MSTRERREPPESPDTQAEAWPCDNYLRPRTCLNAESTTPCDQCRYRGDLPDPAQDGVEVERVALLQTVHNATCYTAMKHTWESGEHVICVRTARAIISTGQWGSARDAVVAAKVAEHIAQAIEALAETSPARASGLVWLYAKDAAAIARAAAQAGDER